MRRRQTRLCWLVAGLALAAAEPAAACSRTTDCGIGDRSYRIVLPADHDPASPLAALVFAHGYRGSAEGTMRSDGLAGLAEAYGIAVVAADAGAADWQLPGTPSRPQSDGTVTLAYFDALRRDLIERFGVDPERIVAAGFSSGGMLVWHLACHRGNDYAGFIPLSGTFWAPLPERCPTTAVNLVHYHGTADPVVPLAGRPIGASRQGDVFEAMALFTAAGGFREVESLVDGDRRCDLALNDAGNRLELCLFDGGHSYRLADLVRALRLFGLIPEATTAGD
jgi:polyhydroxybutyrate depolymerase